MIQELNLKVKRAVVVTSQGTDTIILTLDGPTAYPIMQYDTIIKISTQKGYGEEYCIKILGIKAEILNI
jgi:hypothetical protein